MKKLSYIILAKLLLTAFAFGQSRIEGTQREQPAPVTGQAGGSQSSSSGSVSDSDTGAQRPISISEKGISAFFGYDTKLIYRDNPTAQDSELSQIESGIWTNTFFGGAGLGVFDMDNAIVTPYVGGSFSINDFLADKIEPLGLNYNSTSAYALLLAQYSSGWSGRVGINYYMDKNTETDQEEYSEFFPNIGVMKTYSLPSGTTAVFDAYLGIHSSTIASGLNIPEDNLDNLELAASYGLITEYGPFTLYPKYQLSYKD